MSDFYDSYKSQLEEKKTETKTDKMESTRFEKVDHAPIIIENKAAKKKKQNMITSAVAITALVIIGFIIFRMLNFVTVPDFDGWSKSKAVVWGNQNNVVITFNEVNSDEIAADAVMSQDLEAGSKIQKGKSIELQSSLGPDLDMVVTVPDFTEMTTTEIDTWAKENHFVNVRVIAKYSDTEPLGTVLKVEVDDVDFVDRTKRSTAIYITISKGKEDITKRKVTVPDFKTLSMTEIQEFSSKNYIDVEIEEEYNDYIQEGLVISQSVEAGETIHPGDKIRLVVSKGKKVLMPNLYSLTKDEAISTLAKLGYSATIEHCYSSVAVDRLSWQSIKAGAVLGDDTLITLKYSLGSKINLDSYVSRPFADFEQMINGLNSSGAAITIEKVYTESKVAKGSIISQSHSNQIIDYKTTISVVISSGYSVVVPDFVAIDGANHDQAITKDEAIALAEEKGLIIIFIEESNGARLSGEVWHQSIAAGTEVKQGSTITLKHNPKNATLDVADFDGLTQAEVEAHAQYSKLIITFEVGTAQDGYASGLVYNQTIAPSTTVTEGAEVTLTITP